MKWISRLFCKHDLVFFRNIYGDEIIEFGWKRSLWRCKNCGKLVAKDDLHNIKQVATPHSPATSHDDQA